MKIIVLNGSPKGPVSVTMQYVGYIASRHPEQGANAGTGFFSGLRH